MAKLEIPNALKADVPPTKWGKILTATPVIMTVIATALAGMASSEMTRAQYSRSLGAQQQSKAGDQWAFFQAKRLRSALEKSTLDILQNTAEVHPFNVADLDPLVAAALGKGELPALPPQSNIDHSVKVSLEALENQRPEDEIQKLLATVKDSTLQEAVRAAQTRATAFDDAIYDIYLEVGRLEKSIGSGVDQQSKRDFTAGRLRYTAARYDAEARLNQAIANLYELQVRKSNFDAERHHKRSQQFFYGMLTAQAAVIISTFSLAAQKRSLLWSLAAAAGAAAVSFAIYVYLFV